MSAAPDPAELAPSRDPAAYGRRRLFTAGFFVWVAICAVCLVGGAAIGRFGLAPPASPDADSPPAEAAGHAPAAQAPTPIAAPANALAAPAPVADVGALSERVARLESSAGHIDAAAGAALAAASLSAAAEGSAPFDQDVAAYARALPDDADLRALAPLAARGAPSRAALAETLPALASQAAAAAHTPGKGAGFVDRVLAMFSRVVIVRNVDPAAGGVDGALARAERAADAGDLEGAVRDVQALPPRARPPLAEWTDAARRRIEIDRRIGALRADALAALAAPQAAFQSATEGARP
ncbi:MAG TPA: hypothetical protein VGG29_20045 [Caulobacteraceae bacterium]|jgi:hypothetical protein